MANAAKVDDWAICLLAGEFLAASGHMVCPDQESCALLFEEVMIHLRKELQGRGSAQGLSPALRVGSPLAA